MIFSFNFLKYLISFDFKDFFYLLYSFFYSIFFTKSSFLFGFDVGWNNNFLIIFNMIKTSIVFIWEKLTILIYPLKLFSSLFDFLMQILTIFKDDIFFPIIKFLSQSVDVLIPKDLGPNDGLLERVKQVCKTALVGVAGIAIRIVAVIDVGSMAIHFFKTIQTFLLNTVVVIGNLLFTIVLKILDIIYNCFKILFIFI